MIVIYDLEGFQVAENKSSLSCVVSTGFEDRFGDLLCLSDYWLRIVWLKAL